MSEIEELLSRLPIDQIAGMIGTDPATARDAAEAVLPTLVAGMQNNVQDPAGAASLEEALSQHQDTLAQGTVDASEVDTADGEKIVSHVFGGQTDQVASHLAGAANLGGVGGALVKKLLPILAPIVMSWIAGKVFGRGGAGAPQADAGMGQGGQTSQGGAGGGLGDILGGILGGGQGGASQGAQGGVLGSILGSLGGILGGGAGQSGAGQGGSGGFGDILGSILGGGQQGTQAPTGAGQQSEPMLPPRTGGSTMKPGEVIDPNQQ